MQYTAIFHCCKNGKFQMKKCDIFLTFAQNKKKTKYPCKPQVYYIKVGCKGVYITRPCVCINLKFILFYTEKSLPLHSFVEIVSV